MTFPRAEMLTSPHIRLPVCGHGEAWARVQVGRVDPSIRQHASCVDVLAEKLAK